MTPKNIFPIHDQTLNRAYKQKALNQTSKVLWFTGLSGSGKSTLAVAMEKELFSQGYFVQLLDGDNLSSGLNADLTFSKEDRIENIRRVANLAKLLIDSGVIVICSFVSPTIQVRQMAKEIIGKQDFIDVYVDTPLSVCEERDVKGLYAKARQGVIQDFTGISAPFQVLENPVFKVNTVDNSVQDLVQQLMPKLKSTLDYSEY